MEDYSKKWKEMVDYSLSFLDDEEKENIIEYEEVGEHGLTFDLIVAFVLHKKIPLTEELYNWINWNGLECEKLNTDLLDPAWKEIKLPDKKQL